MKLFENNDGMGKEYLRSLHKVLKQFHVQEAKESSLTKTVPLQQIRSNCACLSQPRKTEGELSLTSRQQLKLKKYMKILV